MGLAEKLKYQFYKSADPTAELSFPKHIDWNEIARPPSSVYLQNLESAWLPTKQHFASTIITVFLPATPHLQGLVRWHGGPLVPFV